jgi:hypothetical protein
MDKIESIYYFDQDRFLNDLKNHSLILANHNQARPLALSYSLSPFDRDYSYYFLPIEKNIKILDKIIIDEICTYDIIEDDALWIECIPNYSLSRGAYRNDVLNPKTFSVRSMILRERIMSKYFKGSLNWFCDDRHKPLMGIIKSMERDEKLNKLINENT